VPNNFPSNAVVNSAANHYTDQAFVPQALLNQQQQSSVFVDSSSLFQNLDYPQQSLPGPPAAQRQAANLPTFNNSQANPIERRRRMGRKKIQITRIQDERNRQVSF
jgi:hypothetical protein